MADLTYTFPIFSLGNRISVADAEGNALYHVRQKLFKLRESIRVDSAVGGPSFQIDADRMIDFSASYVLTTDAGQVLGSVRRRGMRSLWKAHYEIYAGSNLLATLTETNPLAKVADGLLGGIPVVGVLSGYVFHPSYAAVTPDGAEVMRVTKQPAFLEGRFAGVEAGSLGAAERTLLRLGVLTALLLERSRG
jgi:hypothetical protein